MVGPAGNLVERYTYYAYGKVSTWTRNWASRTSPLYFNRIMYGGAFFQDASTRLYYADARYYHPSLGRFISRDPMLTSFQDGVNLYQYVRSNPGNMVDPSGLAVGCSADDRMRPLERARPNRELQAEKAKQAKQINKDAHDELLIMRSIGALCNLGSPGWLPKNQCGDQALDLIDELRKTAWKYWQVKGVVGGQNMWYYHHHVVLLVPVNQVALQYIIGGYKGLLFPQRVQV